MSTTINNGPPGGSPPSSFMNVAGELNPVTQRGLNRFRRRRNLLLVLRGIGIAILTFLSTVMLVALLDYFLFVSDIALWTCGAVIYFTTAVVVWFSAIRPIRQRDELELAKQLGEFSPGLKEDLLSAVELSDPDHSNGSIYFQRVLQNRVARRIAGLEVQSVLPIKLVRRWILSGASVLTICLAFMLIPSAQFGRRLARAALPGIVIERASQTRVSIEAPSPASKYVAQGDAVAVIVSIERLGNADVLLQWRDPDGNSGESTMTPRLSPSMLGYASPDESAELANDQSVPSEQYSANLSVGSTPIEYRVLAGDAITRWHRLTPLPRPKVIQFEKLYHLPEYAELTDRTSVEEHGDLKALQDTTAEVTVTFDQPVQFAAIRYGVRGSKTMMEPVDEAGTRFKTSVSIKTSGQYQIEAESSVSGLDNPFAPMNLIVPVLDLTPIVRWQTGTELKRLVSSVDVLELQAQVTDDLPLDQVLQEVKVNGDEIESYPLDLDSPSRQHDLAWSWDLMHRLGDSSPENRLKAGDVVRTRVVAIDRKGNRAMSPVIELMIAGEGFNSDRHAFLDSQAAYQSSIHDWADACHELAEKLRDATENQQLENYGQYHEQWSELQRKSTDLIKQSRLVLASTGNDANAAVTELAANVIVDIEFRIEGVFVGLSFIRTLSEDRWASERKEAYERLKSEAADAMNQSQRLSELSQNRFAAAFQSAMYSDVLTLQRNISDMAENLPEERLGRYVGLLAGQFEEVDRLLAKYAELLPMQTAQHLSGRWSPWSQSWAIQLDTLIQENAERDQANAVIQSLNDQASNKPQEMIDHGVHDSMIRLQRDLSRELGNLATQTDLLRDRGNQMRQSLSESQNTRDADQATKLAADVRWKQLRFASQQERLTVRTAGRETLSRVKMHSDLEFASDLNLYSRAVKNVTREGYEPYKDETPEVVLNSISRAIRVLEACAELRQAKSSIAAIREGERQPDGAPVRKIYHPIWFRHQEIVLELATIHLRDAGINWDEYLAPIERTRRSDDWRSAQEKFDQRVWRNEPYLSAVAPLDVVLDELTRTERQLNEQQTQARETLKRYVLSLVEQAREAAAAADRAIQENPQRQSDSDEDSQKPLQAIDQASRKATETVQSLIDEANTATVLDQDQRERARDADAASELISNALRQTQQSARQIQDASTDLQRQRAFEKSADDLALLKQRLSETAEHFERLQRGEDFSESRERLRQDAQQLSTANQLLNRYNEAEKLAQAASQDPRELLKQLEQELQRNEAMQDSLSHLASEIVDDAARQLQQASKLEAEIQRRLEQEDDAFQERKQQQRMLLEEFVQRAETLRDRTLSTAASAAGWGNDADARRLLEEARQTLDAAVKATETGRRGDATLEEIQQSARELRNQLERARQSTEQASSQMERSSERALHQSDEARDRAAADMTRNENQLRNQELNALNQQRNRWNSNETQANQRINRAQKTIREANEAITREQERLQSDPNNEWRKQEIRRQQDRLLEAERTEEQAKTTKELARDRRNRANDRALAINTPKAIELTKPNPASELGHSLSDDAIDRLQQLTAELDQLTQAGDFADQLRSERGTAERFETQQSGIDRDVRQSADDLMRASRHERRLGNEPVAEKLSSASRSVENSSARATTEANEKLVRAADENSVTPTASSALSEASQLLDKQSKELKATFSRGDADQDQAASTEMQSMPSADPSQMASTNPNRQRNSQTPGQSPRSASQSQSPISQASPEQMAQTLDELDRTLSRNAQSGNKNAGESGGQPQPSSQGASNGGDANQQQSAQASSGSQSGQNQSGENATDASATLAQMLDAQAQQAAKERMRSLAQAQAGQSPNSNQTGNQSNDPLSQSGTGDPPGGSDAVDAIDQVEGGDWGDLRAQGVKDVNEGPGSKVPRSYAAEVKAYFKALGKRSAEVTE